MRTNWEAILEPTRRGIETMPGCPPQVLGEAEKALGVPLPTALVDLLRYSNGLFVADSEHQLVWPLVEIVQGNLEEWSRDELRLPTSYLGFGDDGAGNWFCFSTDVSDPRVYHFNWIDDEARPVAPSLDVFLPQWIDGDLGV
jgi:SMI1 / KNR4 family (SUKH-1)